MRVRAVALDRLGDEVRLELDHPRRACTPRASRRGERRSPSTTGAARRAGDPTGPAPTMWTRPPGGSVSNVVGSVGGGTTPPLRLGPHVGASLLAGPASHARGEGSGTAAPRADRAPRWGPLGWRRAEAARHCRSAVRAGSTRREARRPRRGGIGRTGRVRTLCGRRDPDAGSPWTTARHALRVGPTPSWPCRPSGFALACDDGGHLPPGDRGRQRRVAHGDRGADRRRGAARPLPAGSGGRAVGSPHDGHRRAAALRPGRGAGDGAGARAAGLPAHPGRRPRDRDRAVRGLLRRVRALPHPVPGPRAGARRRALPERPGGRPGRGDRARPRGRRAAPGHRGPRAVRHRGGPPARHHRRVRLDPPAPRPAPPAGAGRRHDVRARPSGRCAG